MNTKFFTQSQPRLPQSHRNACVPESLSKPSTDHLKPLLQGPPLPAPLHFSSVSGKQDLESFLGKNALIQETDLNGYRVSGTGGTHSSEQHSCLP